MAKKAVQQQQVTDVTTPASSTSVDTLKGTGAMVGGKPADLVGKETTAIVTQGAQYAEQFMQIVIEKDAAEKGLIAKFKAFADRIESDHPGNLKTQMALIEEMMKQWPTKTHTAPEGATEKEKEQASRNRSAYQLASRFKTLWGAQTHLGIPMDPRIGYNKAYTAAKAKLEEKGKDWKGETATRTSAIDAKAEKLAADAMRVARASGKSPEEILRAGDEARDNSKATARTDTVKAKAKTAFDALVKAEYLTGDILIYAYEVIRLAEAHEQARAEGAAITAKQQREATKAAKAADAPQAAKTAKAAKRNRAVMKEARA